MSDALTPAQPMTAGLGRRWRHAWHATRSGRTSIPLRAQNEHRLLTDQTTDGGVCEATEQALYYRRSVTGLDVTRVAWHDIAAVGWVPATGTLTLSRWQPDAAATAENRLTLPPRSRLPAMAAERVTATQLFSRRVTIGAAGQATISAVRAPGSSQTRWLVHLHDRTDPNDPATRHAIDAAVHELRLTLGC
ncbi:MAG: hypothetical protein ABI047_16870 [Jatrophihabitantaceae bacterium]